MKHPYRIVVLTSDKYLNALRPFAFLLNRYWKPNVPVLVAGFTPPQFKLPQNFSFLSIGKFSDYPFGKWSDALIKLLGMIEDEVFVLMLEDYFVLRPVDTHAVQVLIDYAYQFRYVLKIDLCGDRLYAFGADLNYGTVEYIDLVKSMPGSPYHMSLYAGLWRRDNLLRCLVPNESPHDVELVGTTRVSHMQDMLVLGSRQMPLRITLGLRGGNSSDLHLDELSWVDRDEMKQLGFFEPWGIK